MPQIVFPQRRFFIKPQTVEEIYDLLEKSISEVKEKGTELCSRDGETIDSLGITCTGDACSVKVEDCTDRLTFGNFHTHPYVNIQPWPANTPSWADMYAALWRLRYRNFQFPSCLAGVSPNEVTEVRCDLPKSVPSEKEMQAFSKQFQDWRKLNRDGSQFAPWFNDPQFISVPPGKERLSAIARHQNICKSLLPELESLRSILPHLWKSDTAKLREENCGFVKDTVRGLERQRAVFAAQSRQEPRASICTEAEEKTRASLEWYEGWLEKNCGEARPPSGIPPQLSADPQKTCERLLARVDEISRERGRGDSHRLLEEIRDIRIQAFALSHSGFSICQRLALRVENEERELSRGGK